MPGVRRIGMLACCLLSFSAPIGSAGAEVPLPVEKYAALPIAQSARLSPDGTRLAVIASAQGHQVLLVHTLKGGDKVMNLGNYQVRWVSWKDSQRLLVGMFSSTDSLFWDDPQQENNLTRLIAIDSDGTHPVGLGEPAGGFLSEGGQIRGGNIHPQIQDRIAGMLTGDPQHILQTVIDQVPVRGVTPAVYRVDVRTGERAQVIRPQAHISEYRTDAAGLVRLGLGIEGTDQVTFVRDGEGASWRQIYRTNADSGNSFKPLAFVPEQPDLLYVIAGGTPPGKDGLWAFDTKAGTFDHLVDADIDDLPRVQIVDGRLISYLARDKTRKYLDPAWEKDYQAVRKALPGKLVEIIDRPGDGSHVLFEVTAPHQPSAWWILDHTVHQLSPVIENHPDIVDAGIAPVERVTYTARDGLSIPAFVTLPIHRPAGPIPFVVLPHGGPFACDGGGFDYEAQFLASRGWGVLQPEFRGSTCLGAVFEQRGFRELGYAMQDDITDGTRWLIAEKRADPARICIVGSVFGGYAALQGVIKEPDLYRCAAAWAPITDLTNLRQEIRKTLNPDVMLERLGNDSERLEAVSPRYHADRVKVPVLLMQGRADFGGYVQYTAWMETALKEAGKPVEAIYLTDGDRLRQDFPARLAWLQALERFLGNAFDRPADSSRAN